MNGPTRRGRPPHPDVLTPAEWRVVHAVRHGMSNRIIARQLGISRDAVKFHIGNAVAKLGLGGRSDLKQWPGAAMDSALYGNAPQRKGSEMIDTLRLGSIGQISRQVSDIPNAVAWYRDVLGLPHLYTFGSLAFFDCGGTRLFLSSLAEGAGRDESVIYFQVEDINLAHEELSRRGVTFTGAPHLIHRHENGVEEWMAFFSDPDGKTLALMSQVAPKQSP